jgi:L-fucose isomerase-like protein
LKQRSQPFGYIPIGAPLTGRSPEELIADYVPALEKVGGRRWEPEAIGDPLPLFYLVVTGGTEGKILELRQKRKKAIPREPLILLAHPGNNSLPAALEVLARLQQDGDRGRILYLSGPDDDAGCRQIVQTAGDLQALRRLQRARIGLVGSPSDWLVASRPDLDVIPKVWGPEVVSIDFDELEDRIASIPDSAVDAPLDALVSQATEVVEPTEAELTDAVRVYLATKRLIDSHRLDAVTVRCFDLVSKHRTTGCVALARLNDEGVVAGCEGDVVSTTGMLWIQLFLGQTAWMANPARIDVQQNALWLAHCTVPPSMAASLCLRSHFESGLGVSIQGMLKKEPVTLLRIGGRMAERIWLAEGKVFRAGREQDLCRTQVGVQLTEGGHVSELLRKPLGNHLLLTSGHHAGGLRGWWEFMIEGRNDASY